MNNHPRGGYPQCRKLLFVHSPVNPVSRHHFTAKFDDRAPAVAIMKASSLGITSHKYPVLETNIEKMAHKGRFLMICDVPTNAMMVFQSKTLGILNIVYCRVSAIVVVCVI